ncbi:selenocysteine-specific translation elongation factor [Candidatus Pseudothioglobus singularis]|nr:selenocysteine-specific translation elongation factor [Candidatus Pseudothioglobus singularis]
MTQYFTIGMAGHIDHGKTTLTKALTGVDTDRLKEEKERKISIEPGFAPFINEEQLKVSLIDVPGHEKFIRQMIAGVAGIDMFVLVIAADEGIMPQTKEHLDILSLLGIENGLIVITKVDQTDEELLDIVLEDIQERMKQTFLEDAPIYMVDSLSNKGIPELKQALREQLLHITKKNRKRPFRLPIDQVFTVKGQGVVVRGTIYDGRVKQGDQIKILPQNEEVRVRQIQVHHEQQNIAYAGQRAALNIGGISHEDLSRGDVLVADDYYSVSDRIDVVFHPLPDLKYKVKQRQPVKLFIGTSEVMGKIIFFDRNEWNESDQQEILCQVQLDEEIVVTRGDRFILRKPTPVETIGGGWVIEPKANKHRFGEETIDQLKLKKEGSVTDRIESVINEKQVLTRDEILKQLAISEEEFMEAEEDLLEIERDLFTLRTVFKDAANHLLDSLESFHQRFPMRIGIRKAELLSEWKQQYPSSLMEYTIKMLDEENKINIIDQYIALYGIEPTLPDEWKTRLLNAEKELQRQGLEVEKWNMLLAKQNIPAELQKEFYHFLIETERAFVFDDDRLVSKEAIENALHQLGENTGFEEFTIQTAREILQLTRKNLIPLLELLDRLGYTKRVNDKRRWMKKANQL